MVEGQPAAGLRVGRPWLFHFVNRLVGPPAAAADVAAGTGILSRQLATGGYRTTAVEPNPAMRDEIARANATGALSVAEGTGERTGLADDSVDLVTVAQAFHWLDPKEALTEFHRIGKPGCLAGIVWNTRQFSATSFMRDYKAMLLEHAPTYTTMKSEWDDLRDRAREFFPGWFLEAELDNHQRWDQDTLLGNLWSHSYVPQKGTAGHEEMRSAAQRLFETYNVEGHIDFRMKTIVVIGPVAP